VKILTNHPDAELLPAVTHLLVQTLAVDSASVYLISPWLKDVRFPLGDAGHYASLLGGRREEIGFCELLALVARKHKLHVVTKPPSELVDFRLLKRLAEKVQARADVLGAEDLRGYSIVEELALEFHEDIDALASAAVTNAETVRLGLDLRGRGAWLSFLDRLHAKLLWTPIGVLVGSANFTNGGLISNEELMLEVTDPGVHSALGEAARQFLARCCPSEMYSISRELLRLEVPLRLFAELCCNPALGHYPTLVQMLTQLAQFVR
jgi:hypothetical protein